MPEFSSDQVITMLVAVTGAVGAILGPFFTFCYMRENNTKEIFVNMLRKAFTDYLNCAVYFSSRPGDVNTQMLRSLTEHTGEASILADNHLADLLADFHTECFHLYESDAKIEPDEMTEEYEYLVWLLEEITEAMRETIFRYNTIVWRRRYKRRSIPGPTLNERINNNDEKRDRAGKNV